MSSLPARELRNAAVLCGWQGGSRRVATAWREPLQVGIVGQLEVHKLVAERQHGGAGGECGRDDEIVVPELDAPKNCGDDPRGDLENELVDTKTVSQEVLQVLAANVVVRQTAARRGGLGMLVAGQGHPA